MLNQVSSLSCRCGSVKIADLQHVGLASKMKLGCGCGKQEQVTLHTDNAVSSGTKGRPKFDLSSRLGAAMVEGSMNVSHVQDFITVLLRRPPPSKRLIEDSERTYATHATAVGELSMAQVRKLEKVNSKMNIHLMYTADTDLVPDPIALQ